MKQLEQWCVYDQPNGTIVKLVIGEEAAKCLRDKLYQETGKLYGYEFHSFVYR